MSSPQPKKPKAEAPPRKKSYFGRAILVLLLLLLLVPMISMLLKGSSPHIAIRNRVEEIGGRAGVSPAVPGFLQSMMGKDFTGWDMFYGGVAVTSVSLEASGVTDEDLAILQQTPKLTSLGLVGTKIGDAGIANLTSTPELTSLMLSQTKVTDASCDVISQLKNLKDLGIGMTDLTDAGVQKFASLTNLETLSLSGTKITDSSIKSIASLPKLRSLGLDECQISDEGLAALKDCKGLQILTLEKTPVTGSFSAQLAGVNLRSLSLSDTKCDGVSLKDAAFKETLEILNVDNCPIEDAGIEALASFSAVQTLMMNGTKITDEGILGLKNMPNLVLLTIMETGISVKPLFEFTTAPKLQRIRAYNSKVTNEDMNALNGKHLQYDLNLTAPMN